MNWLEQACRQARTDGVSHPDNLPYLLRPPNSRNQAVLLIHGFGATPREMRPLAEGLFRKGFPVAGVRLPGHGTTPEDLRTRTAAQWLAATADGYRALAAIAPRVSLCGLSTGALLALTLAARQPVEGLLLLSPFLHLRHRFAPLAGLLSLFITYQNRPVADHERDFYYIRRPLTGVAQVNQLRRKLPALLPQITNPALVLCSTGDTSIAPGTAQEVYQRLGSREKSLHVFGDDVPHVLTSPNNPRLDEVIDLCIEFLERDSP